MIYWIPVDVWIEAIEIFWKSEENTEDLWIQLYQR